MPPIRRSLSEPASNTSLPLPPSSVSSPSPLLMVSSPSYPLTLSIISVPTNASLSDVPSISKPKANKSSYVKVILLPIFKVLKGIAPSIKLSVSILSKCN